MENTVSKRRVRQMRGILPLLCLAAIGAGAYMLDGARPDDWSGVWMIGIALFIGLLSWKK